MLVLPIAPVVLALRVELEVAGCTYVLAKLLNPRERFFGGVEPVGAALDESPATVFEGLLCGDLCRRSKRLSIRTYENAVLDFAFAPHGVGNDSERTVRDAYKRDFDDLFLLALGETVKCVIEGFDGGGFYPVALLAGRGADHGVVWHHFRKRATSHKSFLAVVAGHAPMKPNYSSGGSLVAYDSPDPDRHVGRRMHRKHDGCVFESWHFLGVQGVCRRLRKSNCRCKNTRNKETLKNHFLFLTIHKMNSVSEASARATTIAQPTKA